MTSYISLLNKIEAFCNAHLQIKKYKGEFKEQMPNFSTMDEKYPVVFVVPTSDAETLELNQFTLDIYCVDIIQKDRANLNTIVSDCHLILKDLYLYFKDGSDLSVDVITDPTMTPLNNFDLDYVAGWVMTITFEVEGYSVCAIPMNPIPPFTPSCEDATYEITDSDLNVLYSGSISSGGNLDQVIQDSTATITDSLGSTLHTLSINAEGSATQAIADGVVTLRDTALNQIGQVNVLAEGVVTETIGDSTAVLKDTAGTTISTTSILAEGSANITAPDTALEVNGTPEGSVVSGSTVDIQLSDSGGTVTPTSVTQVGNDLQIVLPDGGGVVDTDAQNFITTASISDVGQQEAIDMFVKDLKFFSLWDKMKAVYPMVGGNSTAHSYNLRNVAQYQLSFFGGWVHSATGAAPNGTNAYADTGLNISTQYTNYLASHHLSIYSLTDFPVGNGWAIGVGNTATGNPLFGLAVRRETSKDNIYDFGNTSNNGRLTFTPIIISPPSQVTESFTNSAKNFYIGSALSTTSREFRKSSKQLGTSALTVLGTPSNANIWLGAMNPFPAGAVLYNGAEMGCVTIGDGLTTQEIQILYGIVHTYNARLNRAV